MLKPYWTPKLKQNLLAGGLGAAFMAFFFLAFFKGPERHSAPAETKQDLDITTLSSLGVSPEESRFRNVVKDVEQLREKFQQMADLLQEEIAYRRGEPGSSSPKTHDEFAPAQSESFPPSPAVLDNKSSGLQPAYNNSVPVINEVKPARLRIVEIAPSQNDVKVLSSIDNTIPATTVAKAVLLSGVLAATSVASLSDPRPILLGITDYGTLPNRFKSDLRDCRALAGAWGDLQSERIHARLTKLVCIEKLTGEVIEIKASGHISGPDGSEGMRGVVISKAGDYLFRSLWGGIFSGIGNVLSPRNRLQLSAPTPFAGAGAAVNPMEMKDLFLSGLAESGANSMDRLAKYYIERAEQLQPVIEVNAGQSVDIIFDDGSSIGDTLVKQKVSKTKDAHREKAAESAAQNIKGL